MLTIVTTIVCRPVDRYDRLQTFIPFTHGAILFDALPVIIHSPEPAVAVAITTGEAAELDPFDRTLFREERRLDQ